ncbi:MAG: hypothetical protein HZC54_05970 [Verrucomicrobia bacterium]|nr:hypothetical protein [Verrucomicrobiota bacterium]
MNPLINGEQMNDGFNEGHRLAKDAVIKWLKEHQVKASDAELEEFFEKLETMGLKEPKRDRLWILSTLRAHAAKSDAEIAAMLGLPQELIAALRNGGNPRKLIPKGLWQTVQAHRRAVIQAHISTHTLAEIAPMLGVTKERVRSIWHYMERQRRAEIARGDYEGGGESDVECGGFTPLW